MEILLKRAYEQPRAKDGFRILVDRLWPRGIKKADLQLDAWAKDIAPSTELRKWFGHDPKHWLEFCNAYKHRFAKAIESADIFAFGREHVYDVCRQPSQHAHCEVEPIWRSGFYFILGFGNDMLRS